MRNLIVILVILMVTTGPNVYSQDRSDHIDSLYALITEHHISPFWVNSQSDFINLVRSSKRTKNNNSVGNARAYKNYMELIALLGDGHSELLNKEDILGIYPILIEAFDEGYFITRTIPQHQELLGAKILGVEGKSVKEITTLLKCVIPHGNESGLSVWWGGYFRLPGLLHELGISKSGDQASLKVQLKDGQSKIVILKKQTIGAYRQADKVSVYSDTVNLPYHLKKSNLNYWSSQVNEDTYYIKVNLFENQPLERFTDFVKRIKNATQHASVKKLVVDVRDCPGGNNMLYGPLINVLKEYSVHEDHHVYIIIGKPTFSAAISFIGEALNQCNPILVGQPVGGLPNHPGDAETYTLPNSKIQVRLSKKFWINTFPFDTQETISPDLPSSNLFKDIAAKHDESLEVIRNHTVRTNTVEIPISGHYKFGLLRSIHFSNAEGKSIALITGYGAKPISKPARDFEIREFRLKIVEDESGVKLIQGEKETLLEKLPDNQKQPLDLFYEGDFENAEKLFFNLIKSNPDHIELADNNLLSEVMRIFYYQGDIDRAIALLNIITRLHPQSQTAKNILRMAEQMKQKK